MTTSGYRAREVENKENGSILVPFTKKEAGTTYLEVKPSSEAGAPDSGEFFIDFRDIPAAPSQPEAG